ncbi:MAG: peptidyl-prolyl cis-trans isomerase B (cyclophilin B) [Sphingobacteriales bacterium]|jgi:peptidyl-prolyl cis-trans isomerase B (cyclophilin B)
MLIKPPSTLGGGFFCFVHWRKFTPMKQLTLLISVIILLGISSDKSFAQRSFEGKPQYNIEVKRADTLLGNIKVELFPNLAPKHVANWDSLVEMGFYDSLAFHRVIPDFVIQGGDPNSKNGPKNTWGQGQPGQQNVPAEFSKAQHLRGAISAARATDPNSATSQFFICHANATRLDGDYSVYGNALEGLNIVDSIVYADRDPNDNPLTKIEMFITYTGNNLDTPDAPILTLPADKATEVKNNPIFRFQKVDGAVEYELQIAEDSLFTEIIGSIKTANDATQLGGLPQSGETLYWRVIANNGGFFSYSAPNSMKMKGGSVGMQEVIELDLSIYPNPVRNWLIVEGIGENQVIEIYSLTGKKVLESRGSENVNVQTLSPGYYAIKVGDKSGSFIKL